MLMLVLIHYIIYFSSSILIQVKERIVCIMIGNIIWCDQFEVRCKMIFTKQK